MNEFPGNFGCCFSPMLCIGEKSITFSGQWRLLFLSTGISSTLGVAHRVVDRDLLPVLRETSEGVVQR